MGRALVVGAGGFIGAHLCRRLSEAGYEIDIVSRAAQSVGRRLTVSTLERSDDALSKACAGVNVVYYLAAVAHEALARADARMLYEVNVEAPLRWLRAADGARVQRFVWLSSIKVLGDVSAAPLAADAPYRPSDSYARSKVAAERALLATELNHTALTLVRPPLVYGPGVAGNFLSLLRWAAGGLPLPVKGATAPRSMVGIANLCDLLLRLGSSGSGIFHVADPEDWSVAGLVTEIRHLLGRPGRLFTLPGPALRLAAALARRPAVYSRLFEPLQVDQARTRHELHWAPPHANLDQLQETLTWFLRQR